MTAFHSSPRMLGQKQDKFWLTVGLCALTAALIFLPFYLLDGGFFHYAGDFNSQQISFYRYMNGFLKGAGYPAGYGGVKNTFSWATDLGSGTMNAYSFYLYGSPFFWFSLLFPQNWLPYLMVPLLVLKFAVAGGGAYLYLRRYVKDPNFAVLGAALYAFSGWGLYNIFFNHFIDVLALFPWMLWALDETIYEHRHGWFAFWVAVNLLNNYFFFVGQVLFLVIYFVCKLSAGEFRLTPRLFGQLAFESLLGVALGFVVLWPTVLSVLQNPRTIDLSSGWGFLTYSKPQQYLAILLSWVLPPDSPYMTSIWSEGVIKWTSMTAYLPLCSLAGALAYWRARQGDSKKRIVATCAVFALVPVLNSAFYALNSSYYARWFYMPVLILAAMTINALEDPAVELDRPARNISGLVIATLAFALVPVQDASTKEWSLGVLQNPGQYAAVFGFALIGLLVYRWVAQRWRQDKRLPQRMLAAVLAYLIGLPVLKLKSDYLAIATLGFAEIIRALVQLEAFAPVTNGSQLLRGFPYFTDTFMPFVIVGICIAVVVLLINSTYGRAFKAIRDDEIAAEAMGINLAHHKRMAFTISSFFAGISGALLAMYQTTVQANTFKSAMTYEILLIVVIGGIGSISGSCIGSFLFIACSEWWLRFLDNETYIGAFKVPLLRTGFRMVVFSVIIMIVVLFFRKGIMGTRELSLAGLADRLRKESAKGGKQA